MNEIKVKTEMCEKDRELISDLTHAIVQLTIQLKGNSEAADPYGKCFGVTSEFIPLDPVTPLPDPAPEAPEQPEPTEPEESEEPGEEEPKITKEDIQQKVVALSSAGKKDEVKAIVRKHADRVSAIPPKSYAEVWRQLTELEVEA